MNSLKKKQQKPKELKDQFDLVDTDGSGLVDRKELHPLLKNISATIVCQKIKLRK